MPLNAYSITFQPVSPPPATLDQHMVRIDTMLARPWAMGERYGADAGRSYDVTDVSAHDRAALTSRYQEEHWRVSEQVRPDGRVRLRFVPPPRQTST